MSEETGALIDDGERLFEDGLEAMRAGTAGMTHHNAYLTVLKSLVTEEGLEHGQVCSLLAFATVLLIEERVVAAKTLDNWDAMAEMGAERYRLAWQNARQRATDHLAALVESDEERDYLGVELQAEEQEGRRYRVAWTSARRRAATVTSIVEFALGEVERLHEELRKREYEVAELVKENADFKGLVR